MWNLKIYFESSGGQPVCSCQRTTDQDWPCQTLGAKDPGKHSVGQLIKYMLQNFQRGLKCNATVKQKSNLILPLDRDIIMQTKMILEGGGIPVHFAELSRGRIQFSLSSTRHKSLILRGRPCTMAGWCMASYSWWSCSTPCLRSSSAYNSECATAGRLSLLPQI